MSSPLAVNHEKERPGDEAACHAYWMKLSRKRHNQRGQRRIELNINGACSETDTQ